MKHLRYVAAAALVAAGGLGVGTVRMFSDGASAAPPAQNLTLGLQDKSSGDYLLVQLDPAKDDFGALAVSIPGTGLVWPGAATTVESTAGISHVRYDGDGFLDATAQLDGEFGVNFALSGDFAPVRLRVDGVVDTSKHTGVIEVWIDSQHYQVNARAVTEDPVPVAQKYVGALRDKNLGALYDVSDSDVQSMLTRQQFINRMSAGNEFDHVSSISLGRASVTTNEAGVRYARFPLAMTVQGERRSGELVLIWDHGQWRVFTSR